MARLLWNPEKEQKLLASHDRGGVTFADCVVAIEEGRVLDDLPHPTRSHQRLLILSIENYAYVVPYVTEPDGSLFLKTVFPSRKHTALYLRRSTP
jgi:hypothetical protein